MLSDGVQLAVLAAAGVVGGLWLLARGFRAFGDGARIADTSTSRIASLAVGEVRVSGVVEPAELTLVSPLQSATCVYYDARVEQSDGETTEELLSEQRAIGFRVRDASGSVRVFPHGARFDVPVRWDERDDGSGAAGLNPRRGGAFAAAEPTREEQIAALLTVRPPRPSDPALADDPGDGFGFGAGRTRRYREARIEPGEVVTVVGQVLPFDQLPDPTGADQVGGLAGALLDEETAANVAAAREAGLLAATPEQAWGNAAIPGFGIGRPVGAPVLDPAATAPPVASTAEAERARRTFDIAPHELVLAASPDVGLVIALGPPEVAAARHEQTFLVGLLGAVLAIASAVGLAVALGRLVP